MSKDIHTFGDLFSGVGGISLGLERAGWECAWQVENDPYCRRVLAKHWPKLNDYRYGDIHEVDWTGIQRPTLIAGGFPCQPVSVAGKQLADADERWLWPEFLRCIRFLRPELVLVENVPGLLVRGGLDVLRDLAACGYDVEWDTIPASAFGAPHLRYRIFLVGYLTRSPGRVPDTERSSIRVERECRWKQHGERREDESRADGIEEYVADSHRGGCESFGLSKSRGVFRERGSLAHGRSALWEFRDTETEGWWATEPSLGRVAHGVPSRVDRLRALGNSVVPQLIEWVGRRLLDEVET